MIPNRRMEIFDFAVLFFTYLLSMYLVLTEDLGIPDLIMWGITISLIGKSHVLFRKKVK